MKYWEAAYLAQTNAYHGMNYYYMWGCVFQGSSTPSYCDQAIRDIPELQILAAQVGYSATAMNKYMQVRREYADGNGAHPACSYNDSCMGALARLWIPHDMVQALMSCSDVVHPACANLMPAWPATAARQLVSCASCRC